MQFLPLQLRHDPSFGRSSQGIRLRLGKNRANKTSYGRTVQNEPSRRSSSELLLEKSTERCCEKNLYDLFYGYAV